MVLGHKYTHEGKNIAVYNRIPPPPEVLLYERLSTCRCWVGMSIEIGFVIIAGCADVILRPGWRQVLLYKCLGTAKQLMCTAQFVQA